jgi:hypothetical protein
VQAETIGEKAEPGVVLCPKHGTVYSDQVQLNVMSGLLQGRLINELGEWH